MRRENIFVEVRIPIFEQRFDMELPLLADVDLIIKECLCWISEQIGITLQEDDHFLCNCRTREILKNGSKLIETSVVRGDTLIIF